jgi:DNA-binding CsgD family transcriptional regulator
MEVRPLTRRPSVIDPLTRHASALIEALGTSSFESCLFRFAQDAIRCEHLNAFAFSENAPPRMILAASNGDLPVARTAGTAYVSQFWGLDPANQIAVPPRLLDSGVLIRRLPDETSRLTYRRDCYSPSIWSEEGVNLIERLSIAKRCRSEIIRISFYRHRQIGPFEPSAIKIIETAADLLFALAAKHDPLGFDSGNVALSRERYQRCLAIVAPSLSPREMEVCAGIAAGMSSEEIADALGIKLNTVLTHRKHAYARLHIRSQNQLLTLIFSALAATGQLSKDRDGARPGGGEVRARMMKPAAA